MKCCAKIYLFRKNNIEQINERKRSIISCLFVFFESILFSLTFYRIFRR